MFRSILVLMVLCFATMPAQAYLSGRSALTPGGTDYRAYYDTVLNITWLADANLATTNTFGVPGIGGIYLPGEMTWDTAEAWIAAMNTANYLGVNDWRLPTATDTGAAGCDFAFAGTDCGWNVDLATGELAHLFYSTLGNPAGYNSTGEIQPCYTAGPQYCLTYVGPISNFRLYYWYGTEYAPDTALAWGFTVAVGLQSVPSKDNHYYAWPVRPGDINPDEDGDGVAFAIDNCTRVANPTQLDADQDGYGNRCDGDFNNTGAAANVNTTDYSILRSVINKPASFSTNAARADLNGDGTVNTTDYSIFRTLINKVPGPSGYACAGTIPCP